MSSRWRKPVVVDTVSVDTLVETVRTCHADAMTALAADVHPYSAEAIRQQEAALDAALSDLADRAREMAEAYRLERTAREGMSAERRDAYRTAAKTAEKLAGVSNDRDRLARRVAELEQENANLMRVAKLERDRGYYVDELTEARRRVAELEQDLAEARSIPPMVRATLEKALRLDMTKPPVTQDELRAALDLLPDDPSIFRSINGMAQLADAERRVAELEAAANDVLDAFDHGDDLIDALWGLRSALAGDGGGA